MKQRKQQAATKGKRKEKATGAAAPQPRHGQQPHGYQPSCVEGEEELPVATWEEIDLAEMKGPTDWSNWAVKDSLLVGAYPKKMALLSSILEQGITRFVCLMTDKELERQGTLYYYRAKQMLEENPKAFAQRSDDLQYVHFPIYDRGVADDEVVISLVNDLRRWMHNGEKIYLHCRGGHGRTGTIVSILFGKHYGLSPQEAMDLCQRYHDTREDVSSNAAANFRSPESNPQRSQVFRILSST
ncbi:MAP kinase phosphatase 6 [Balamuthia mandrillaris]